MAEHQNGLPRLVAETRNDDAVNGAISPLVADNADVCANGRLVADRIGFRGICYAAKNSGIEKHQADESEEAVAFDHWYGSPFHEYKIAGAKRQNIATKRNTVSTEDE
jgi:hypothetical protein